MFLYAKLKWLAVVVLLAAGALPATMAGAAAPARASMDPAFAPCNTLAMRDLGTVLPSQVQGSTAAGCTSAASVPVSLAADAAPAVTHRLIEGRWHTYADGSPAVTNRLIDGRWHTYADGSPAVTHRLIDGRWHTYGLDYGAVSRVCTMPSGRISAAAC